MQTTMLDAVSEVLAVAFLVYDRNDELIYASRLISSYFPVPPQFLTPGTRLRDYLGALYDAGWRGAAMGGKDQALQSREEWIAEHISAHWRERSEVQQRDGQNRWMRLTKRRLPSGYGICLIADITEQKKREEQWRADMERVQLTEEILDDLPQAVFVQDRNLGVVAVNKAFCAIMEIPSENVLGGTLASAFADEIASQLTDVTRHVLETGTPSATAVDLKGVSARGTRAVLRSQRVGKPGRYFIVTSFADAAQATSEVVAAACAVSTEAKSLPQQMGGRPVPTSAVHVGRKALLVTSDTEFEAKSLRTLQRLGLDACCVHDAAEQEAFLSVARSVGVVVDLIVVDIEMDVNCLEVAESYGVGTITLDGFQLDTELAFLVMEKLSGLEPSPHTEDWEISTGDGQAPASSEAATQLVLVAEDNDINQIVFSQILEGLGYAYRIAADGEEAVRLCAELRPDIVLMDVTLPRINGFEACRRIRAAERGSSRVTPVIGVLVQAFERDREECFAAGMNDVILKPLSPDAIEAVIARVAPELKDAFVG
ncbi:MULTISPECIES: response regulator [Alphaproteobacteria]|uniref:Two-component system response regulator n=2 Tax=Alphaproteobacteria TaxID=28211 RepID=A0A512HI16_9HYPH|nr:MULTISPECIES: response regulator [Alphaproteobacteria]GEO85091.1 two-component system response regulator [Ciceribacter naphthalenivorans]